VASFRSTLDEVREASLILIVADVSHPSAGDQFRVVADTLDEIGALNVPTVVALNKSDCAKRYDIPADLLAPYPDRIAVSALRGDGLDPLKALMAMRLPPPPVRAPAPGWRNWPPRTDAPAPADEP
jgi:GTP-binding protein HflX